MGAPISSLPTELLLQILTWVRRVPGGTSSLFQCLTVSKQWHEATLPVLYRHLVLTLDNIGCFTSTFSSQRVGHFVRSLTVRLELPTLLARGCGLFVDGKFWVQEELLLLTPVLATLDRMKSFSLRVSPKTSSHRFWVVQQAIQALVFALPQSCVNIEVDTFGRDLDLRDLIPCHQRSSSTHICEALRHVLPRMRIARIRISKICSEAFGTFTTNDNTGTKSFNPVKAPHLETLLINCWSNYLFELACCNPKFLQMSPDAWARLVSHLSQFADTAGACSPFTKLCILGIPIVKHQAKLMYNTILVSDISCRSTCAFPILRVSSSVQESWLMRVGQGRGIISCPWTLEAFAEGRQWVDLPIGARLPRKIAKIEDEAIQTLPTIDEEEWRIAHMMESCPAWQNEALVGSVLFDAETRVDLETYSALVPITEEIPPGWRGRSLGPGRTFFVKDEEEP